MKAMRQIIICLMLGVLLTSCSIRHMAIKAVANGLSGQSGGVFATDDVPEFVGEAIPFGLKLNEVLLNEVPDHKGLLLATASGFTQYAYVFLQLEADFLDESDRNRAGNLRDQARRLYLRSRNYAVRGIEVDHPGFMKRLQSDHSAALKTMKTKDVPFLYWTGASWAAAISLSKTDLDMVSELYLVEAIMKRAFALDPDYGNGALHEFFITFDSAKAGDISQAREHFNRVVELTNGAKVSPYVSFVENVSVRVQDIDQFNSLISKALSIDPDAEPRYRLENLIYQRRASWLKANIEDLFLDTEGLQNEEEKYN